MHLAVDDGVCLCLYVFVFFVGCLCVCCCIVDIARIEQTQTRRHRQLQREPRTLRSHKLHQSICAPHYKQARLAQVRAFDGLYAQVRISEPTRHHQRAHTHTWNKRTRILWYAVRGEGGLIEICLWWLRIPIESDDCDVCVMCRCCRRRPMIESIEWNIPMFIYSKIAIGWTAPIALLPACLCIGGSAIWRSHVKNLPLWNCTKCPAGHDVSALSCRLWLHFIWTFWLLLCVYTANTIDECTMRMARGHRASSICSPASDWPICQTCALHENKTMKIRNTINLVNCFILCVCGGICRARWILLEIADGVVGALLCSYWINYTGIHILLLNYYIH